MATSHTESLHSESIDDVDEDMENLTNRNVSADIQDEINKLLDSVPQIDSLFTVIDKIGEGTFSSVYLGRLKAYPDLKQLFALKHITPTSHPTRTETELRCLQEIGGVDNVMGVKLCLREKDHVVIVMPYFPHHKFLDYVKDITPAEVQDYMRNLLIALRRVHEVDIIHRDVKPTNFLYNSRLKQYALVDFGLAHKAPVPLKTQKSETLDKAGKKDMSESTPSQLKRKCRKTSLENENDVIAISPISGQQNPKVDQQTADRHLAEIEINKCAEDKHTTPPGDNNSKPKPAFSFQKPIKNTGTTDVSKPFSKACRSPRRVLLTKRALGNNGQAPFNGGASAARHVKNSAFHSNRLASRLGVNSQPSCQCFGQPMVCSVCMTRVSQVAARAGTPGFRSPEVLMKCPDQTTAVDIWSAGVIFLSLLSGRYPFFRANDDLTALSQVISIFGSENLEGAAKQIGKQLLCSPAMPALDLRMLCEKLRGVKKATPSSNKSKSSPSKKTMLQESAWSEIPDAAYDVLSKMLELNPHQRITAEQALRHPYFTS